MNLPTSTSDDPVACLCAIMAAVQPRSMLYGTLILHLIIDNNSAKSSMKSNQRKWNDSNMDSWENETFYETANKVFVSVKQHIKSRNYACDATEVTSKLQTFKFNAVNPDVVKDEFSFILKSVQNPDIAATFLISDNDNTSGKISKVSNMSCAKDMIFQQIPKLCSL